MKSINNIKAATKLFLKHDYRNALSSNIEFDIQPIKGYMTTNVYKLSLSVGGDSIIKYIKESSDLSNSKFNDFIKTEYENTKYIYDNFNLSESISVVKPIVYYDDYKLFFMDNVKGDRLDKVLLKCMLFREKKHITDLINLSKRWLREFQSISHKSFKGAEDFDFSKSERGKIKHLHVRSLENCLESDVELIDQVFDRMYFLADNMKFDKSDVSFKHNDYAPWNVMIKDGLYTVYDFADMNIDYKYYDLMYFIHSLSKLAAKIPLSKSVFELMKKTMLQDEDVSSEVESYYTVYFHLQDVALLLARIKAGGIKSIIYRYKYKVIINEIAKYFEEQ